MPRGQYTAWPHVAIGFAFSVMLWTAVLVKSSEWLTDTLERPRPTESFQMGLLGVGFALSFAIFYNRWRCIEAYTSESLSGVLSLSALYAPVIALVYSHIRGARKFIGG